ncbi:hypothetical protein [Phaeovulum sp.]|uniref:hypothetical protein n=1 Tax=Phaeovulum sp. TaxID=2934796 RepID=UPI0039E3C6CB
MEAGTGIEPVFTDLQSNRFQSKNNALSAKKYQDKAGTGREPETLPIGTNAKENPGALAGATGAINFEQAFKTKHYRDRAQSATALCHSIADCDPQDACEIMAAALADLSIGMPIAPFYSPMDEAGFWADYASRAELKAYVLACYTRLSARDQAAFLAYVQRGAAA